MAGNDDSYQYEDFEPYAESYEVEEEQGVDFSTESTPQEQAQDLVEALTPTDIGTYTTLEIDDALNSVQMDVNSVSDRTTINEGKLADGTGLFATISTATTYQDDVAGRAQAKVDGLVNSLQTDDAIANILPKFARQSDLTATSTDLQAKFQSGGGVNLLLNSSGYAIDGSGNLRNWATISGSAKQYLGADCIEVGAGITIATGVIQQSVTVVVGQPITLTVKCKKDSAGTGYVKLSDGISANDQTVNLASGSAYDYNTAQIANFIPQTSTLTVELGGSATTVIFTAIMLNKGVLGLQWSHANGEAYNGIVSLDINGVKVISTVYDGYTVMSPSEFSGYYKNSSGTYIKVFTLNKDTTEVSKLNVTDPNAEIKMGTVKMIKFDNGTNRGWAFVPS